MRYQAPSIPNEPENLPRLLDEELPRIEGALQHVNAETLLLDELNTEPEKPRNGMIVFADGVGFVPNGTGTRGIYAYNGNTGAWTQMLSLP